ncbi:MAG: hypothetical protein J1E95_11950, partial [Muribaculaceae bacterium]|nr:hypothetical protein [Muribaculaceae bacterium]
KRAFKYARQGEEIQLKPKILVIDELEILHFGEVDSAERADNEDARERIKYQSNNLCGKHLSLTIRVVCSKGTYIRALARDIGQALASGGYLTDLIRTRIGEYRLKDCMDIEQFPQWLDTQTLETEEN